MESSSPLNLSEIARPRLSSLARLALARQEAGWTVACSANDAISPRPVLWAARNDPDNGVIIVHRIAFDGRREDDGRVEGEVSFAPAYAKDLTYDGLQVCPMVDSTRSGCLIATTVHAETREAGAFGRQRLGCYVYNPTAEKPEETLKLAWKFDAFRTTAQGAVALADGHFLTLGLNEATNNRAGADYYFVFTLYGPWGSVTQYPIRSDIEPFVALAAVTPAPIMSRKKGVSVSRSEDIQQLTQFGVLALTHAKHGTPEYVRELAVPPLHLFDVNSSFLNMVRSRQYTVDPSNPTKFERVARGADEMIKGVVEWRLPADDANCLWPRRTQMVVPCGGVNEGYARAFAVTRRESGAASVAGAGAMADGVEQQQMGGISEVYAMQDDDETIIVRVTRNRSVEGGGGGASTGAPHFTRLARWSMNDDSSMCRAVLQPRAHAVLFIPPATLLVSWTQLTAPPPSKRAAARTKRDPFDDRPTPPQGERVHRSVALDLHPVLRWSPLSHAHVTSRDFRASIRALMSLCLRGGDDAGERGPDASTFADPSVESTHSSGSVASAAAAPAPVYGNDWPSLPAEVVELIIECAWVAWPLR